MLTVHHQCDKDIPCDVLKAVQSALRAAITAERVRIKREMPKERLLVASSERLSYELKGFNAALKAVRKI